MSTNTEDTADPLNVFICSAGHSGSTLLDMLLGSHSRAESLGELVNLPLDVGLDRPCACRSAMSACPLWTRVLARMGVAAADVQRMNLGYSLVPPVGAPRIERLLARPKMALAYLRLRFPAVPLAGATPGLDSGLARTLEIYDHVRALTGKTLIVDSSKHYVRAAALYRAAPENTRIVLLVRDGRGVFYSGLKRGFGRERSLDGWSKHYIRALELLPRVVPPERMTLVRYEDLVLRPEATLTELCTWLGLPFERAMLDYGTRVHHNVNGNNMKFRGTSELELDEQWKAKLGEAERRYFDQHAGALNRHFGYV